MPNIRAQVVGPLPNPLPSGTIPPWEHLQQIGIYIWASNGKEVWITKPQIRNYFVNNTSGTRAQRRQQLIAAMKNHIRDELGEEQLSTESVDFDADDNDGTPNKLEVS